MAKFFLPRIKKKKKATSVDLHSLFNKMTKGYKEIQRTKKPEQIPLTLEGGKGNLGGGKIELGGDVGGNIKGEFTAVGGDKDKLTVVEETKGILIPKENELPGIGATDIEYTEDLSETNIKYNLIPRDPKKPAFAKANITWDDNDSSLTYNVIEPELNPDQKDLLKEIKTRLEEEVNVDFSKLQEMEIRDYLSKEFEAVVNSMKVDLLPAEKQSFEYYIMRDFIGIGPIEPLMHDPNIEDISCAGLNIPIFVFHRNPNFGSLKTNITFKEKEDLDSFAIKLAQKSEKTISVADPLLDGTLPDGSRVQATLSTDIARRGSNFTIRKFTEKPITPIDVLNYNTVDTRALAYLWMAIEFGKSMVVSGGTATGKTSMLNALSLFIKPERKIVSIEDTAELRLPHPHWVPEVARESISAFGEQGSKSVDLYDLLKASLRQRPEYIIVGEVRGKEAYVMFQQMATGHTGLSTIHADSIQSLIDRLTTPPVELHESLIQNLELVIFMTNVRYRGSYIRKVNEIYEITGYDKQKGLLMNRIFNWNRKTDKIESNNPSFVLQDIADSLGAKSVDVKSELSKRMRILNWMQENDIVDYRDCASIFNLYYTNPEGLMNALEEAGY